VPLVIDFLAGRPAGSIEVAPMLRDALTLDVFYTDAFTASSPTLSVTADQARDHGGIDAGELVPETADPVAITAVGFSATG
jgi:hypothetical protein